MFSAVKNADAKILIPLIMYYSANRQIALVVISCSSLLYPTKIPARADEKISAQAVRITAVADSKIRLFLKRLFSSSVFPAP